MRRLAITTATAAAMFLAALGPAAPAYAAAPPNDDFADAQPIAGPAGVQPLSVDEATTEPGEPEANRGYPSVWYRWTAPADGWYEFWMEGEEPDWCYGTTPVYQGDSLESLTLVSHAGGQDIWGDSDAAFVLAEGGQSYAIAAASTCGGDDYTLTLNWEQDAPLIVTVVHPDGRPGQAVVELSKNISGTGSSSDLFDSTDSAGRVYFSVDAGQRRIEVRPRSVNLLPRNATITVPAVRTEPVRVTARLRSATLDLDRDGIGDVVSGMPAADRGRVNAGAVVVRFGNGTTQVIDEASGGVPSGRVRAEQFGAAVVAGDVNRDGWLDLMVGAPGEVVGKRRPGAIFIVFGSAEGLGAGRRTMRLHMDSAGVHGSPLNGDRFGAALVAGLRPNMTDFFVGLPGRDVGGAADAGAVVRFTRFPWANAERYMPASKIWHQNVQGVGGINAAGDRFGSALAYGGFDSKDNWAVPPAALAIGVPGKDAASAPDAGAVVVVRGASRGVASRSNPLVNQNSPVIPGGPARAGNRFGASLANVSAALPYQQWLAEDVRRPDFLAIGAPGDGGGVVTVLRPGASQPQVFAPVDQNTLLAQGVDGIPGDNEAGDAFGASLSFADAGDDNYPDLVVGAPGEGVGGRSGAGAVTVLSGDRPDDLDNCCIWTKACCRWTVAGGTVLHQGKPGVPGAPSTGARFGHAVAAVDTNGDGWPDVAAGAPNDDTVVTDGGAVFTLTGGPEGFAGGDRLVWSGARAGDRFGASVADRHLMYSK